MKKITLLVIAAASFLTTACVVPPPGGGYDEPGYGDTRMGPVLPPLVILDADPFYFYNGYHYHYLDGRWFYSRSRSGPWTDLPRNHYPREVRFKNRDGGRDHHDGTPPHVGPGQGERGGDIKHQGSDGEKERDVRDRGKDREREGDVRDRGKDRNGEAESQERDRGANRDHRNDSDSHNSDSHTWERN